MSVKFNYRIAAIGMRINCPSVPRQQKSDRLNDIRLILDQNDMSAHLHSPSWHCLPARQDPAPLLLILRRLDLQQQDCQNSSSKIEGSRRATHTSICVASVPCLTQVLGLGSNVWCCSRRALKIFAMLFPSHAILGIFSKR